MEENNGNVCPLLLEGPDYTPDSINLTIDEEARVYWIHCFEELSKRFVTKVESLHPGDMTAKKRAEACRDRYLDVLSSLNCEPLRLGPSPLSIRILLDLNERLLRENGFVDAWKVQKQTETGGALKQLAQRLHEIDSLDSLRSRWTSLCEGLLAGNMFDWGAQAVADILDNSQKFDLTQALQQIECRPWLVDNLEDWLCRVEGPKHNCAAIFVDNAGIDLVLGILPVARELLRQNTEVYLCANSAPALNDVTYAELKVVVVEAAHTCQIINTALKAGKLKCYETGQGGPCLDLRNLHEDLYNDMCGVDLMILEGMGRALHTNLYARFSVDCLKLAVVKNEWLAHRLGGKKFSVVCQYEPAPSKS